VRTLSETLGAAQKEASVEPYVRAEFSDFFGDVARLRFERFYTGAEGEYFSAACIAGDGSLIRARIDPSTKVLYRQRVTSPGPGSTYSSWTSVETVSALAGVALAALGSTVVLAFVDADTLRLRVRVSTNNGSSFGSASTVATAAGAPNFLALAIADGGHRVLFWNEGGVVYRSRWNGTSWGTRTAWTNSVGSVLGLACAYFGDWCVVVAGKELTTDHAKLWATIYGDGGLVTADTWSDLYEVLGAEDGTLVTYRAPAVCRAAGAWRLFFVERYTGTVAYQRLHWSTMKGDKAFVGFEAWREPFGFDRTGLYGVAVAPVGSTLWLSAPDGVWHAAAMATTPDQAADVLEAVVELEEWDGRLRLVLRNDDGRYSPGGAQAQLVRRGMKVDVSFGLVTSEGAELPSPGTGYWIESVEYVTGAAARAVVHGRDGWGLLERWRARRQFAWAAGQRNVFQLLVFVCGRAGLDFASLGSASAALSALYPAFTVHPGESGRTAVRRLLEKVPDVALLRAGTVYGRHVQASDSTVYEYGTDHAVLEGRYRERGPEVNRARAFGVDLFDERFDFAEIELVGERAAFVHDLVLTTGALAGDRAARELRAAEVSSRDEQIRVRMNGGAEVWDLVALTDAQMGLSGVKRRVLGAVFTYTTRGSGRGFPRYDLVLRLGAA
jgi:hypothetical protein